MTTVRKVLLSIPLITLWSIAGNTNAFDCTDITASAQIDDCSKIEKKSADKKINDSYKKLIARIKEQYIPSPEMGERYLSKLKNSQRAWIRLRDTNCELESFIADTAYAAHETLTNNCITKMSLERSDYLDGTQP